MTSTFSFNCNTEVTRLWNEDTNLVSGPLKFTYSRKTEMFELLKGYIRKMHKTSLVKASAFRYNITPPCSRFMSLSYRLPPAVNRQA